MKRLIFIIVACYSLGTVFAQSPNQLQYQAIMRNSSGAVVANQAVGMRVSLLKSSATGSAVYSETHRDTTTANGLVTVEIGAGTIVSGSLASINWGQGLYFIKTETDITGGTNYQLNATTQLLSVPYALYANDVPMSKSGDTILIGTSRLIVPGATFIPGTVPASLDYGLIAYYPFSGNAQDSSGNGNHGTVNGATLTSDRFNRPSMAYNFDGINDHVLVSNSATLNPTSISISCWIQNTSLATNSSSSAKAIISKWYGQTTCLNLADNYNLQLSELGGNSVIAGVTSKNPLITTSLNSNYSSLNIWSHIVFIHDENSGQYLFINGVKIKSNTVSGKLCSTSNVLLIGCDNGLGTFNRYFGGKIDDLRIYNRVLNEKEVEYLLKN